MSGIRSSLARHIQSGLNPDDAARLSGLCGDAWRDKGLLVVSADDPMLTLPERQLVRQLGMRKYGQRV